jgi:hypothetical protein
MDSPAGSAFYLLPPKLLYSHFSSLDLLSDFFRQFILFEMLGKKLRREASWNFNMTMLAI